MFSSFHDCYVLLCCNQCCCVSDFRPILTIRVYHIFVTVSKTMSQHTLFFTSIIFLYTPNIVNSFLGNLLFSENTGTGCNCPCRTRDGNGILEGLNDHLFMVKFVCQTIIARMIILWGIDSDIYFHLDDWSVLSYPFLSFVGN